MPKITLENGKTVEISQESYQALQKASKDGLDVAPGPYSIRYEYGEWPVGFTNSTGNAEAVGMVFRTSRTGEYTPADQSKLFKHSIMMYDYMKLAVRHDSCHMDYDNFNDRYKTELVKLKYPASLEMKHLLKKIEE